MNKTLLTLLACAAVTTAAAGPLSLRKSPVSLSQAENTLRADRQSTATPPQRAAGTLDFTMAGEPDGAFKLEGGAGKESAMAFEISPELATLYAGNQITQITFYTGGNSSTNSNQVSMYTGFIANDFDAAPIVRRGTFASTNTFTKCSITLSTPVTIEAGKRYVVGVSGTPKTANDFFFVYDGLSRPAGDDAGGWIATRDSSTSPWVWRNVTDDYGFICVGCVISGDNIPENLAAVSAVAADEVAQANTPFAIEVSLKNSGGNAITSIDYTYTVGDEAPAQAHYDLAEALASNNTRTVALSGATYPTPGKEPQPVTISIDKVNGKDNIDPANTGSSSVVIIPKGAGYSRNMVVEEGTSIKCGYCPRGIWSLEYLREKYTDGTVACVAVHGNGQGPDPMYTSSWADFERAYISGYPSGVINRKYETGFGGPAEMEEWYQSIHSVPALNTVQSEVMWGNAEHTKLFFKAKTEFVFDYEAGHPYILSFAATEDKVGPYTQTNYYSGASYDVGGWEKKGSSVSTIYNDVARTLDTFQGIEGSVPASIQAGKENEFNHMMELSGISKSKNVNAIVYLLNKTNGQVENVIFIPSDKILEYDESGLTEIAADENAPVEYFNLQGIRVENPSSGLYIKRQGSKVTKVIL